MDLRRWTRHTIATATSGAEVGSVVGFSLGSFPGICIGATCGSAAGSVGSAVNSLLYGDEPGDVKLKDDSAEVKPKKVPHDEDLDCALVRAREAGRHGSLHGARVGGMLFGWAGSVPGALVGCVCGGIGGMPLDILSCFSTGPIEGSEDMVLTPRSMAVQTQTHSYPYRKAAKDSPVDVSKKKLDLPDSPVVSQTPEPEHEPLTISGRHNFPSIASLRPEPNEVTETSKDTNPFVLDEEAPMQTAEKPVQAGEQSPMLAGAQMPQQ